ncbi:hypothetical protein, partial [Comamonas thiooxydans]|uniref:hypothetical protein n=1 Tax=Comamonas thiooxydans TaxID=363952 RepID=UPI001C0EDEB5
MSASASGRGAARTPKTGDSNAETALNSPILGCAVSCRGKPPAIGWRQTCFEHHPKLVAKVAPQGYWNYPKGTEQTPTHAQETNMERQTKLVGITSA